MKTNRPSQARALRYFLFTSLVYLSLPTAQAAEVGPAGTASLSFAQVDRNHDGVIDSKEASFFPQITAIFKAADKNGDGKLDEAEFAAAMKPS